MKVIVIDTVFFVDNERYNNVTRKTNILIDINFSPTMVLPAGVTFGALYQKL
jgi:hypothetical protein